MSLQCLRQSYWHIFCKNRLCDFLQDLFHIRKTPKKNSCSFGFCPNEGGGGEGPAQIFCPLFTNCIYWVNLEMGREGETPAQIFLAHWRSKIIGTSCPN